jgi:hypothetical protein
MPFARKGFVPPMRDRRASKTSRHLGERATLVPERGGRVHGMLMSLTHAELDRLYAEPSVEAYRPEPVLASLRDGSIVAALCFNLPAVPAGARSNPEYAAKLRIAAKKMGLPENYVATIGSTSRRDSRVA